MIPRCCGKDMLIVPGLPAYVCGVCGARQIYEAPERQVQIQTDVPRPR